MHIDISMQDTLLASIDSGGGPVARGREGGSRRRVQTPLMRGRAVPLIESAATIFIDIDEFYF